jgi:predicted transcriptional regulator
MDTVLSGDGDATEALNRNAHASRRLRELGEPAQRMWQALVPMGQAAANDPALLDRLGWSRVRASQVLNRLEDAGLVESSSEKAPHGRPRKVYRPAVTGAHLGAS